MVMLDAKFALHTRLSHYTPFLSGIKGQNLPVFILCFYLFHTLHIDKVLFIQIRRLKAVVALTKKSLCNPTFLSSDLCKQIRNKIQIIA